MELKSLGRMTSHILPIGSMYGIYANIGDILMVNVTIYSIHGSYGLWKIKNVPNHQPVYWFSRENGTNRQEKLLFSTQQKGVSCRISSSNQSSHYQS